jgi:hypothetical protein
MDLTLLNWIKDFGVGVVGLYVMGRVIYLLAEAAIVYWKGLREDNKERNEQFAKLLSINADEVQLTRKAIEHMTRSHRSLIGEVASLGERLVEEDNQLQLHLDMTTREAVDDLKEKIDDSQTHILLEVRQALQPALDKLDELEGHLADARVELLAAFEKAVQTRLPENIGSGPAQLPGPSEN